MESKPQNPENFHPYISFCTVNVNMHLNLCQLVYIPTSLIGLDKQNFLSVKL